MDRSKSVKIYKCPSRYRSFAYIFAIFGLPKQVVSDNGPPFGSKNFLDFCKSNGIECLKSPPYHPQSNGSAERGVQTIKSALKKFLLDPKTKTKSWNFKINNFLLKYRSTPTTTTNSTPAELVFKYKPKTLLDLLNPNIAKSRKLNEGKGKKENTMLHKRERIARRNVIRHNRLKRYCKIKSV